jgi:hypothetical protein
MSIEIPVKHTLPGFEDYVCTGQCLKHCPFPEGQCIWDDPEIGMFDRIEYPEFFWWRLENLTADQKRQLMEPGSDLMILTPDCLDQFYPEPEPFGQVYRCNRCLSTDLDWQAEWIVCRHCGYAEPLYDFPVARRYDR